MTCSLIHVCNVQTCDVHVTKGSAKLPEFSPCCGSYFPFERVGGSVPDLELLRFRFSLRGACFVYALCFLAFVGQERETMALIQNQTFGEGLDAKTR